MMEVAENYGIKYNLVDPNSSESIGLNPFVYSNPLKTASVFTTVVKTMYQSAVQNIEKVSVF